MEKPINWPAGPFYIEPRLSPGWVLGVTGVQADGYWIEVQPRVKDKKNQLGERQLWTADHSREGGTLVRNSYVADQLLTGIQVSNGTNYVALSNTPNDPYQLWAGDYYPGDGYVRIQSPGMDWFLRINEILSAPNSPVVILTGWDNDWNSFRLVDA
jgi:hypothetical protein